MICQKAPVRFFEGKPEANKPKVCLLTPSYFSILQCLCQTYVILKKLGEILMATQLILKSKTHYTSYKCEDQMDTNFQVIPVTLIFWCIIRFFCFQKTPFLEIKPWLKKIQKWNYESAHPITINIGVAKMHTSISQLSTHPVRVKQPHDKWTKLYIFY